MNQKILILSFIILLFSACTKKELSEIIEIKTNQEISGKSISIKITEGENWSHDKKFGVTKFTIKPQIAIWTESLNGDYLQTLYVTQAFAKQNWYFAKYKAEETIRTMCMPYWFNKYIKSGKTLPNKNNPLTDSVTSATPKSSFTLNSNIQKNINEVIIFAEINKSFDPNDKYSENRKKSQFNGQPSVIYSAKININNPKEEYIMTSIGKGGETGSDPNLYSDISDLTTALSIIKEIKITLN